MYGKETPKGGKGLVLGLRHLGKEWVMFAFMFCKTTPKEGLIYMKGIIP